jgi:hypothetical protein
MALQRTQITIPFVQGIDRKTDEFQIPIGKFQSLDNSVFDTLGMMKKRNGFGVVCSLSDTNFLTTFKNNLLGVGTKVYAYNPGANASFAAGYIQPLQLSTIALTRNFYSPSNVDSVTSTNSLVCYTYQASSPTVLTQTNSYYAVADANTGQNVVSATAITPGFGTIILPPKTFYLNNRFLVAFEGTSGSQSQIRYFTINPNTLAVSSTTTLGTRSLSTSSFASNASAGNGSITTNFDGAVANNTLYMSWSGSSGSGILAATINSAFAASASVVIGSGTCDLISVATDTSTATTIFTTWVPKFFLNTVNVVATNESLAPRYSAKTVTSSTGAGIINVTSASHNGINNAYLETAKNYAYDTSLPTNYIRTFSFDVQGSISNEQYIARSVGLASKAFIVNSFSCVLSQYSSAYQSTYFLHSSQFTQNYQTPNTLLVTTNIVGKLAYGNAFNQFSTTSSATAAYLPYGVPNVSVIGSQVSIAYLNKTTTYPVNKGTSLSSTTPVAAIYSKQGINISSWNFGTQNLQAKELGNNLHFNGGYLWMYDGVSPLEHNFLIYPDNIKVTTSTSGGNLADGTYYYQVIWEWQDAQGNTHRSAPSLPVGITTSGGGTSTNTIRIPCLRLTQRVSTNPVVFSIYRWSNAQQFYIKIGPSIVQDASALATDFIPYADTTIDSLITGNEVLYTNGGEVENIGAPAFTSMSLFDSRLWGIMAEDPNVLWYSKPVVQSVPVEMSDLFTFYMDPTVGPDGATGGAKCLFPMDDKLIIFKRNSIYYVNGTGPDVNGANSQYSEPIFVTTAAGCSNQNSIALIPPGIMFQSEKGIWLLGRDLSTKYIGAPVEAFNSSTVLSSTAVPETNQIRFNLDTGQTLMYDYYVDQWGTFSSNSAISGVVYQNLQTILTPEKQVRQETIGSYSDGAVTTLMAFTTGWVNLAGLQGYQRVYELYLLGKYQSPHAFRVDIAYDYDSSIQQTKTFATTNVTGSGSSVEQWQINFSKQQCEAFQLTFTEIGSASAGAGVTLSGMTIAYGAKKGWPQNIAPKNRGG